MNKKWKTFEHNGLAFPPLYEPKNLTISINNKILNLTSDQEEMAYAWVKKRETPYVQDPVFIKNFLFDFLSYLNLLMLWKMSMIFKFKILILVK